MSINFSSNFIPKDSESISNNPNDSQKDMLVQGPNTKAQLIYESLKQDQLEAREKYDRMTPSEQADYKMQSTISLKRMSNYALSDEELRWLTTKKRSNKG